MRIYRHILTLSIILLGLLTQSNLDAQQDYLASQYNFNSLMLNPAYAGAHPYLQTSSMYRNQWRMEEVNGVDGMPTTQLLCVDGLIPKTPIGLGLVISSDKIGVIKERAISVDASYRVRTQLGKISFGIRAGHIQYKASLSDLLYWDLDDPIYNQGDIKEGFITLGFGTFFISNSGKWFGGISSPSYYARDHNLRNSQDERYYKRHYYFYGGGIISTNLGIDLKPSVMIRHMDTQPLLVDVNIHALFLNNEQSGIQVWLGTGYRSSRAFLLSFEVKFPYNLRLGYSFDVAGMGLYNPLGPAHEIQIGFNFGGTTTIIQSPRYF